MRWYQLYGERATMSYYRAALAAAAKNDLTMAIGFVRCSIAFGEDAPSAEHLLDILHGRVFINTEERNRLNGLLSNNKFRKAAREKLADTVEAHLIRGLLYAHLKRHRLAMEEVSRALAMDVGNELARRTLEALFGR